jgi:haloacetate dehalogenase
VFDGFEERRLTTPRGEIFARIGGQGPPLLLLHGFPESHLMWHAVAPALAVHFTVVAADLPGYGDSFRPPIAPDHSSHGKRAIAADVVAAMESFGAPRFALAGHDRGARVAYRLALDHPDRVTRLAVLDVIPTGEVWARADRMFALGYWHWGFLAQPAPLPERLILADPDTFFDHAVARMGLDASSERYPPGVLDAYRAALRDPDAVIAMCEDYRAGAGVDAEHDAAGGEIACPVLALWGARGALPVFYDDVLAVWRPWAPLLSGGSVDAGHFVPEDAPEATAEALLAFLLG